MFIGFDMFRWDKKNKKQSGSVSSVQNLDLLDRLNLIPKIAMGGLLRSQRWGDP
jgi:hypothetical protein